MESRTALVTAITTRVMLTFTAGFLVKKKKWGAGWGSILSAFFGTINEGFLLKGRMKTRENMEPLCQNLKLLSVWEGRGVSSGSEYI